MRMYAPVSARPVTTRAIDPLLLQARNGIQGGSSAMQPATQALKLALVFKGVDGVLEILGGILLTFVPIRALTDFLAAITAHELSRDPDDMLAHHASDAFARLSQNPGHF